MRRVFVLTAALVWAVPAAAALAWDGPAWYVMRFDEGGWHNGLSVPYATVEECRETEARWRARNSDPEIEFDCVHLPSAPIPDSYHPYVTLPSDSTVDSPPLRLHR